METENVIEALREMGLYSTACNLSRCLRRDYRTEADVRRLLEHAVRDIFTARLKSECKSIALIFAAEALCRFVDWTEVATVIATETLDAETATI